MAPSSIKPALLSIKVLHSGKRQSRAFLIHVALTLTRRPSHTNLTRRISHEDVGLPADQIYVKAFESYRITQRHTGLHTDRRCCRKH